MSIQDSVIVLILLLVPKRYFLSGLPYVKRLLPLTSDRMVFLSLQIVSFFLLHWPLAEYVLRNLTGFCSLMSTPLQHWSRWSPCHKVEKPNSQDAMSSPYRSASYSIDWIESSQHTSLPYPDAHTTAHMMLL